MDKFLVFLLLLWMPSTGVAKKLKRIEDRIARIETKHDIDSMTRREDISDLAQRLDDMETWLNSSLTDLSVSVRPIGRPEVDTDPGKSVAEVDRLVMNDIERVKSAFADEKARWRRHASDMEHSIKAVQNGLSSELLSLVKAVKNELAPDISKMMTNIENVMDNLNTLQSVVQDTLSKCSASSMILDKLGKMENICVAHKSSVEPIEQVTSGKSFEQTTPGKIVKPTYSSCLELSKSGERKSGAYDIVLAANTDPIRVYCDMATDGGSWTVFQRRQDGSEDFFRGWDDYASGFGNVEGEFWLGNDYISQMTSGCCHELRIDIEDFEGNSAYAKYGRFKVFPRGDDYKLDVGVYSGNASDSLNYHSGWSFTTKDKDNDQKSSHNCAKQYTGAWWYVSCHYSNLNGVYFDGGSTPQGISWYNWKRRHQVLKKTEMKFRKL